jgi:predicted nucleic acid-binding protein
LVCDASAIVTVLLDSGEDRAWVADRLAGAELFAPALLPFECANIIRRHELAGSVAPDQAAQAHADLLDLPIHLWPYEVLADRVRELRSNLTSYEAAYVALAETVGAQLITLDRRLQRVPGIGCSVQAPPVR